MYEVVLLIEKPLSSADAHPIADLYAVHTEPVHIHVLLPVEDASARVESALGSIAASEVLAASSLNFPDVDLAQIQRELAERSKAALDRSIEMLRTHGCHADGIVTSADPVEALAWAAQTRQASEVVILTRPHLVAEFFHVDWTSKARRKIGVPCLHLIEHRDPDDTADSTGETGDASGPDHKETEQTNGS